MIDIADKRIKELKAPTMPDDVAVMIDNLKDYSEGPTDYWGPLCDRAADMLERRALEIATLQAQVAALEALLRKAAEGTWWDGNEPFTIQRLESWIVAALQENEL